MSGSVDCITEAPCERGFIPPAKAARRLAMAEPFYITTAISYPNGRPHIGHAYEAIATDAIARFQRMRGRDVFFLTGTDEHGLKMKQTAIKEGIDPRALADRNSQRFRDLATALNLSNDDFIRTTEPRHYRSSEEIWRRMAGNSGDIFLKTYAGWYSVRDEAFYAEKETTLGPDGVRLGPQGTPVDLPVRPLPKGRLEPRPVQPDLARQRRQHGGVADVPDLH